MKVICLVLLVFLVAPLYGIEPTELTSLLTQLRSEIGFLQNALSTIETELMNLRALLQKAKGEYGVMEQKYESFKSMLEGRLQSLAEEKSLLSEEKARLEKDYLVLKESEGSPLRLKNEFTNYRKSAESTIKFWRVVGIVGAIGIGTSIYLLLR